MKARKNLKCMSILILALAAFTFVRVIVETFLLDFNMETLPEGATAALVLATQIGLCVFSCILLLPQIYVGVKGMKISKDPNNSKAHIVWATILAVISVIGIVSPLSHMVRAEDIVGNLVVLLDLVTDVAVYIAYVVYAKQVLKAE
jgi:hypothetical protein